MAYKRPEIAFEHDLSFYTPLQRLRLFEIAIVLCEALDYGDFLYNLSKGNRITAHTAGSKTIYIR